MTDTHIKMYVKLETSDRKTKLKTRQSYATYLSASATENNATCFRESVQTVAVQRLILGCADFVLLDCSSQVPQEAKHNSAHFQPNVYYGSQLQLQKQILAASNDLPVHKTVGTMSDILPLCSHFLHDYQ